MKKHKVDKGETGLISEKQATQSILYLNVFHSLLPYRLLLLGTVPRNGQDIVDVVENFFLKVIK